MALDEIVPYPGQELTDEQRTAVARAERFVPGPHGQPDVRVLLYRPRATPAALPLIVSIHGGGFALRADHFAGNDARLALLGAQVVSIDYRITPEHPFPAGVEDCYAALCWAAAEFDPDGTGAVVTGASAGGALSAAVGLMARDRGGPPIRLQALNIPVTDDRCATPSMRQYEEAPLFGARAARGMWTTYLGEDADRSATSPYAAPNRAVDLSGLPAAFVHVAGWDPLRDEGIDYAMRLMAAGVDVELYCSPRMHHGVAEDPRTAQQATRLYEEAITAAIATS